MLPWSTALLSMAQMLLVAVWIVEGVAKKDRGVRWQAAFGRAPSLVLIGFLALHVIGLAWTSSEGMEWGISLLRILLPVLVFGVVLSGSPRLSIKEYRFILLIGAWSVIASTIVSYFVKGGGSDYRELSMFISHIRLALLLCMSIAVFLWFFRGSFLWRIAHSAAVLWSLYFIDLLGSIQAIIILLVVGAVMLWRRSKKRKPGERFLFRSLAVLPFILVVGWIAFQLNDRYSKVQTDFSELPKFSAGGEAYVHMPEERQREHGELVWTRIAWAEVHRTWPRRSSIPLDSLDGEGHMIYPTLFRYLTSLGLPKDSAGIMALSDRDVQRIEAGVPNAHRGERLGVQDRFNEVMFEIDRYRNDGVVSGHSVTMRLEFWRTGLSILRNNMLFGVGTGDTQIAFDREYERLESRLAPEWRHRAHNQYLTWAISFGIPGALVAIFCLWWPASRNKAWRDPLFVAWTVIIAIASLTDDTVETQAGATFFALYYALFVFASPITGNDRAFRSIGNDRRSTREPQLSSPEEAG